MILLMLFGQAVAAANSDAASFSQADKKTFDRSISLSPAERVRGSNVYDSSGSPVGTIYSSDSGSIILLVGGRPIQVPANALQKVNGRLVAPMTRQQIELLWTGSASYQAKYRSPAPATALPHQTMKR